MNVEQLDPWILDTVNRIIDAPELYHREDSTYNLEMEYKKVHELLSSLRNSEEFKKGLKIKKMLGMK